MILRHLRYLAAVAEHGSIVAASQALRVAQPSLSRQIRALEKATGANLLERSRRGVQLTASGIELLDGAHVVRTKLEEALARTRLAHLGQLGILRLTLGRAAIESRRVGRALTTLRGQLPNVTFEITEVDSFAHPDALADGSVDLAIGLQGLHEHRGIHREALFDDCVDSVMLTAGHQLAGERVLTAEQLRGDRLLMLDPLVAGGFPELFETLRRIHQGPVEIHENAASLYALVAAGRGWIPALSAARENAPAGTVIIPLQGLGVRLRMGLSYRSNDRSTLIANAIRLLRQEAEPALVDALPPTEAPVNATLANSNIPHGLEARHLRALTVTIAEGSVSRAAERLGITQSGLSRQLRALENELGIELFERTGGGLTPNAAGIALRAGAATVLGAVDEAVSRVRGESSIGGRSCRIGTVPRELVGDIVFAAVRRLEDAWPEATPEVSDLSTPRLAPALLNRLIDVGIGIGHPSILREPLIASSCIRNDALEYALLSSSHPLSSRTSLTPSDLHAFPFLFIPRSVYPEFFDAVMSAMDQISLAPRVDDWFSGARSVWRLVADGLGWTVGNGYQRSSPPPGLVAVPIVGFRVPTAVYVMWRRDESESHVHAVLRALGQAIGD